MFFSAQKNKCCSLDFHQDHNIYYRAVVTGFERAIFLRKSTVCAGKGIKKAINCTDPHKLDLELV